MGTASMTGLECYGHEFVESSHNMMNLAAPEAAACFLKRRLFSLFEGHVSSYHCPDLLRVVYHPNMYSMALLTIPLLLVGVLVPGTTLFSSWASLYA